jgi:drug/metabolite transporter (DMT)-like permease
MLLGSSALALLGLAAGVQSTAGVGASGIGWAVAYGLGWLSFATLGGQYGVTHLEAGRSSIIIIIELLAAVASAIVVGGERMEGIEIAGGCLIVLAAVIEGRTEGVN